MLQVEWEGAAESPEERKQQLEDSPQGVVSAVLRCELTSSWCSIHVMHSCQDAAGMRSGLRMPTTVDTDGGGSNIWSRVVWQACWPLKLYDATQHCLTGRAGTAPVAAQRGSIQTSCCGAAILWGLRPGQNLQRLHNAALQTLRRTSWRPAALLKRLQLLQRCSFVHRLGLVVMAALISNLEVSPHRLSHQSQRWYRMLPRSLGDRASHPELLSSQALWPIQYKTQRSLTQCMMQVGQLVQ